MAKEVVVKASTIAKRKKRYQKTKLTISIVLLILIFSFIILSVIYKGGRFTITLDPRLSTDNRIVIYEDNEIKESKRKLVARDLDFMDNISIDWIPHNIDTEANGSHNGENYIAYTFYIENEGEETINYWYMVLIDDVIKNVDEAARVMIYKNGEKTVYAKTNSLTKEAEKDTKPFFSKDKAVVEQRNRFAPGDVDKYTIVIWLEGDDPECVDKIIGGALEFSMRIDAIEENKTGLLSKLIQDIRDTLTGDDAIGAAGNDAPDYYKNRNVTWETRRNQ